jgi:hypothetical protein
MTRIFFTPGLLAAKERKEHKEVEEIVAAPVRAWTFPVTDPPPYGGGYGGLALAVGCILDSPGGVAYISFPG